MPRFVCLIIGLHACRIMPSGVRPAVLDTATPPLTETTSETTSETDLVPTGGMTGESGSGCEIDISFFPVLGRSSTDISTVIEINWETAEPVSSHLIVRTPEATTALPATAVDTSHQMLLRGLLPHQQYTVQAVAERSEGLGCSVPLPIQTGGLPKDLPDTTLSIYSAGGATEGFTIVPIITTSGSFATILDAEGQPVWTYAHQHMVFRTALALDRRAILIQDGSNVRRIGFEGTEEWVRSVELGHTDFVEFEAGQIAMLARDIQEFDGRTIMGDKIVEVDESGTEQIVWSVFDSFRPNLDLMYSEFSLDTAGNKAEDWTHANGLSLSTDGQAYLVTLSGFDAVARIDRSTGVMEWLIADEALDEIDQEPDSLHYVVPSKQINQPHSARAINDDQLLVFNRGLDGNSCSEAIEMTLDEASGIAEETWAYQGDECTQVFYLGEAHPLHDGNVLVVWSTEGRLDQVTPAGESVWRLEADQGVAFGFVDHVQSLY